MAFHLPMHTATRLALKAIARVREANPAATLCAYGLYAPLNEDLLRERGVQAILGGEFEAELAGLAAGKPPATRVSMDRLNFIPPDRAGLPPLERYAKLVRGGEQVLAGATEASRGCKHLCRHCPIVPVYNGTFRVVPVEVVLADIAQQVEAGARHITFGDPDFFNGPAHAMRIVRALTERFPEVSFDATIKVSHLLQHRELAAELAASNCAFVTTAVESLDDEVLAKLRKGHTRADFLEVARRCRELGLTLNPTFIAFTPWTTLESYRDLLSTLAQLHLVEETSPIQLALRLLIPRNSPLLELQEVRETAGPFDPVALAHPWRHRDPAVDRLARQAFHIVAVEQQSGASRRAIFERLRALVHAGGSPPDLLPRAAIPYLNEPWYC